MAVRNLHWVNQNASRKYPVDDAASAVDDAGVQLPPDILADLNLRWPDTLGPFAVLSGVAVTPTLVTVVLVADDGTDTFAPLAALSVPQPVDVGRVYALLPQAGGVAGWVVFGRGVQDRIYYGRFSTAGQARVTPRAGRAYRPLPVTGLGAAGAGVPLTGLITLKAVPPLVAVSEDVEIDGVSRPAIVVRLADTLGITGFPVPAQAAQATGTAEQSVFVQFAGPCGGRPESRTCGDPQPIETVNSVVPDCDGVITLMFDGCRDPAQIVDGCGIAVTCDVGLGAACLPALLPDSDGILPGEVPPIPITPPVPPVVPPVSGVSESYTPPGPGDLPYVNCFTDSDNFGLDYAAGAWEWASDDSPTLVCPDELVTVYESISSGSSESVGEVIIGSWVPTQTATRSVAIWDPEFNITLHRKVVTEVLLLDGPLGVKRNAALIFNYKQHPSIIGQWIYYQAEIDYDTQQFRISRWTGTMFQTVQEISVIGIALDVWYRLAVTVVPVAAPPGSVKLTVFLDAVTGTTPLSRSLSVTTASYAPSLGGFGLGTNRALARFAYFTVEEYP